MYCPFCVHLYKAYSSKETLAQNKRNKTKVLNKIKMTQIGSKTKRNSCETDPVSLNFAMKINYFFAKPAHPNPKSLG